MNTIQTMYAIRNVRHAELAWSNEYGWVDDDSFDLFTEQERQSLNLPIEGKWQSIT